MGVAQAAEIESGISIPCDVCKLLRGDETPKETTYCSLCDANICSDCWNQYDWRTIAAMKRAKKAMAELFHNIFVGA